MDKNEMLEFVENLAKGIDPFTGELLTEDTVLNDVKYVRAFYALRDILIDEIENGLKGKKTPFILKTKDGIVNRPLNMSAFIDKINEANLEGNMKKLTRTPVMEWLMDNNYIMIDNDKKRVTARGLDKGIYYLNKTSSSGREYQVIMYPVDLLNHILDLMETGDIAIK